VFASHDHVYFGRHEDGVLESEFCGNLVEICPPACSRTDFKKHYTRKWDLQTAPSICVHCAWAATPLQVSGTHTEKNSEPLQPRGERLLPLRPGRFGYEFVNSEKRIRQPLMSPSSILPSRKR